MCTNTHRVNFWGGPYVDTCRWLVTMSIKFNFSSVLIHLHKHNHFLWNVYCEWLQKTFQGTYCVLHLMFGHENKNKNKINKKKSFFFHSHLNNKSRKRHWRSEQWEFYLEFAQKQLEGKFSFYFSNVARTTLCDAHSGMIKWNEIK